MTAAETTAPHFEIERVVKRTFSVLKNNLVVFGLLSLIAVIPSAAFNWFQPEASVSFFDLDAIALWLTAWLLYVIGAFALQAAVVHSTVADLNGRRASFVDCLATGLKHFLPLLLIAVIYSLCVFVGLIVLVIPGIMIAVMMSVAVPARVVEQTGVITSFYRSQDLTDGHRWAIFGLFVAYFIIQLIISTILFSIMGTDFLDNPTPEAAVITAAAANTWPALLASALAQMISAILSAAGTASIYYELRQIKEGIGPESLASMFD
jgi:hypothetical protein